MTRGLTRFVCLLCFTASVARAWSGADAGNPMAPQRLQGKS